MSVPAFYQRGASFKTWAHNTTIHRPVEDATAQSIREHLEAERKALLDKIDWNKWSHKQSQRLGLLDYLLGI